MARLCLGGRALIQSWRCFTQARLRPLTPYRSNFIRCHSNSSDESQQNGGQQEKFISLEEVVDEIKEIGMATNYVFTDDDDDTPVWELEEATAVDPSKVDATMPQIERAANPGAVDVTSAYSPEQGFMEISAADLHRAVDEYSLVLDVRTKQEFQSGHVPNAVNIPLQELNKDSVREANLEEFQDKRVAVICASGARSAQATVRLTKVLGFEDVVNVAGGTLMWISSGFPVEK